VTEGRTERVDFGSGLRSHIAHEVPAGDLAEAQLGPDSAPTDAPVWEVPAEPTVEPPQRSTAAAWVRDLLRARAGEQAERIWSVFDDALRATGADGRPDHELRLLAARALLAEIYGPPSAVAEGRSQAAAPSDQLAAYRRSRRRRS
jgi:hypothetical protein